MDLNSLMRRARIDAHSKNVRSGHFWPGSHFSLHFCCCCSCFNPFFLITLCHVHYQWRWQVTVDLCLVSVEEISTVALAVLPFEGSSGRTWC